MALFRIVVAALPIVAIACSVRPGPAFAQEAEIVVEAPSSRIEIERILVADNLNTATMEPHDIVATMRGIPRGTAPEDFWTSYQQHLGAWQRFAAGTDDSRTTADELKALRRLVNATFDAVERLALRYGARLPDPR